MDKTILIYLILAQINSDAGKGIEDTGLIRTLLKHKKYAKVLLYTLNFGYKNKNLYIRRAMDLINKSKHSNFRYHVWFDPQYDEMQIVYFNFRINGVKYQCSFHTFSSLGMLGKHAKYITRWDKKSSRVALYRAAKAYGL